MSFNNGPALALMACIATLSISCGGQDLSLAPLPGNETAGAGYVLAGVVRGGNGQALSTAVVQLEAPQWRQAVPASWFRKLGLLNLHQ